MTDEQRASYIISQSVCALAEIEYPFRTESDFQGVDKPVARYCSSAARKVKVQNEVDRM
jgi:hypothetical protein